MNGSEIPFQVVSDDSSFVVPVNVSEGDNLILVEIDSSGTVIVSDSLKLTLGYKLRPEILGFATVSGNELQLHCQVVENPEEFSLSFLWQADENNPGETIVQTPNDSATMVTLLPDATFGEYYFNLTAITADGDTVRARTFVTLDSGGILPFQIKTDHAAWIDRAVLYEITPGDFVNNGKLADIRDKIPELAELGITAVWLQPIFGTPDVGGMGYGITDYFAVREDFGTEAGLFRLVETAHEYGLKLLLDIVPNHSFVDHPYAVDAREHGTDSHYYDYYQRDTIFNPDVPYSQFYNSDDWGFVNYFWDQLPNLNYDNPEVRRWMTEICRYWIEKFDIDGYRFDAVWGVTARRPEFTQQLRLSLKRVKPDILMLAEDKASWPTVFEERFDVGFDWGANEGWVSQWSWQVNYNDWYQDNNVTIFNSWSQGRSYRLRNALTNNGDGYHPRAKVLRFMENNDTQRFIRHHGLERTKMVAALMFSLNGVPLLFNGQEIGYSGQHPYYGSPIFNRGQTIESLDTQGLYPFYKKLMRLRKTLPALTSKNFEELPAQPYQYAFAFRRWDGEQHIFTVLNLGEQASDVEVTLPFGNLHLDSLKTYYLTDLLSGKIISGMPGELATLTLSMEKYSTQIFLLADTITVVSVEELAAQQIPASFELKQNFPNPFNPSTTIQYTVPGENRVSLKVYNVLGELVATLVDDFQKPGSYQAKFEGVNSASGVYLYRLEIGEHSLVKKMLLVK